MKSVGLIPDIVTKLMQMDLTKLYQIDIKEYKNKRSIEQNKKMWVLIHEIARATGNDDMQVYCGVLERADVKSDYIITAANLEESLKKSFRAVKFIRMQEVNGKDCYVYKVYLGSSKMNTQEMSELLEITLDICGELGIETET
jgi:RNA polymerase-interacting CarD/CdnL/TRCF family regulator